MLLECSQTSDLSEDGEMHVFELLSQWNNLFWSDAIRGPPLLRLTAIDNSVNVIGHLIVLAKHVDLAASETREFSEEQRQLLVGQLGQVVHASPPIK